MQRYNKGMTSKLLVPVVGSHVLLPACHPSVGAGMDTVVDKELPATSNDTGMLSALISVAPNLFVPPKRRRFTAVKTRRLRGKLSC